MRNVSRAWAYETGLAAGVELGRSKWLFVDEFTILSFPPARDSDERIL